MKDPSPTLASILIIGTFASVSSAQRDDVNNQSLEKSSDYLKMYNLANFDYVIRENSEKTTSILDKGTADFTAKAGYNLENYDRNAEGFEININDGYTNDLRRPSHGSVPVASQSMPKHSYVHRSATNYSSKSPIQILPSRFPPPLEKLIQNIQNYFSTYNHPDLQNRPYTPQSLQVVTSTERENCTTNSLEESPAELNEETTTEGDTVENSTVADTTR